MTKTIQTFRHLFIFQSYSAALLPPCSTFFTLIKWLSAGGMILLNKLSENTFSSERNCSVLHFVLETAVVETTVPVV